MYLDFISFVNWFYCTSWFCEVLLPATTLSAQVFFLCARHVLMNVCTSVHLTSLIGWYSTVEIQGYPTLSMIQGFFSFYLIEKKSRNIPTRETTGPIIIGLSQSLDLNNNYQVRWYYLLFICVLHSLHTSS
jgi:hypothetical protein